MTQLYFIYVFVGLKLLGLVLFGGYFIWSGINHFIKSKDMIGYATFKKVPYPALAVYVSGAFLVIGGLSLFAKLYSPLYIFSAFAPFFLVFFLVPVTFMMHAFWKDTDPATRMNNQINFLKNLALLGAVLLLL